MKKIILLLALVVSISLGASAMSLKEAFNAIANVPNMSVNAAYNAPILGIIKDGETAKASNLDASQILESGNAVFTILNQVPLVRMINGGNNNSVAAFVYATTEAKDGLYEVLMVLMSGKDGDITAVYGGMDETLKTALQSAPLYMEGSSILIKATLPNGEVYTIQAE